MDVQSFSSAVGVKAGKVADVKHHRLATLAAAPKPIPSQEAFEKILAAEGSKDEPQKTSDLAVLPSAHEPPLLEALAPVAYNATVPFLATSDLVHEPAAQVSAHVFLQKTPGRVVDLPASTDVRTAPAELVPQAKPRLPVAPLTGTEPAMQAKPVQTVSPASGFVPSAEPVNLKPLLPSGTAPPVIASPAEPVNLKRPLASGVALPVIASPSALLPAALAGVKVGFEPEKLSAAGLLVGAVNPPALPELKAKLASPLKFDAGAKPSDLALNSVTFTPPPSLDEAGRKNEALLDLLALGGSQPQPEGLGQDARTVYAFQREPDSTFNPSTTGQTLLPEAPQAPEKNSYWAAGGVQNMAITLDGLGDESVAVKISLAGLDTRIDIRTDHTALRQMIEGTAQDMKEQLRHEGLNLSSITVGTSSQDQSMGQSMGQSTGQSMGRESQKQTHREATPGRDSALSATEKNLAKGPTPPKSDGRLSVFA